MSSSGIPDLSATQAAARLVPTPPQLMGRRCQLQGLQGADMKGHSVRTAPPPSTAAANTLNGLHDRRFGQPAIVVYVVRPHREIHGRSPADETQGPAGAIGQRGRAVRHEHPEPAVN